MQFPSTPAFRSSSPRCNASSITASTSSGAGSFVDGVTNELDGEHRAHPANVSDPGPARLPIEHARTNRLAEELRALDELLLLEDVEHGARRCERDGVTDERPADRPRVRVVHDLRPADHA